MKFLGRDQGSYKLSLKAYSKHWLFPAGSCGPGRVSLFVSATSSTKRWLRRPGKTPYRATANIEIRPCVKQVRDWNLQHRNPQKRSRSPKREMVVSKGSSSSRALTEKVFGVLCQWLLMGGGWSFIRKVAQNGGWTVFIDADSLLKLSVVYAYIIICWLLVIFRHNGGPLSLQLRAVVGTINGWSFKQSGIISDG